MTHALSGLKPGESLTLEFGVTPEDLIHGTARNCFDCPAARALDRALPGVTASVGVTRVHFYDSSEFPRDLLVAWAQVPDALEEFVFAVDSSVPVQPAVFTLVVIMMGKAHDEAV